MTATWLAATMILALAQAQPHEITFQGCVTPGLDKGTYVLSPVAHIMGPDAGLVPEVAHGRRVLFWLDNDVPNATVGTTTGTGGRIEPGKNDIKTYLLRIDVKAVKATGTCQ